MEKIKPNLFVKKNIKQISLARTHNPGYLTVRNNNNKTPHYHQQYLLGRSLFPLIITVEFL